MPVKAIRLEELGGPQNLHVRDVDPPAPQAGEVLVRVRAAALNHRDVYITRGLYPGIELPRTLGSDACGDLADGTRVVINPMLGWGDDPRVWRREATILGMPRDGTFAHYVCVPSENVFSAPAGLSDEEAAALPLAGLTAYRAVFTRARVHPKETVLVTGIGGGVQTFVLLFAKSIGARVVVTSSSDEKLARARELGADETLNYRSDPNWHKAAKKWGIDVAIDAAGGQTFAHILEIVKPGARVVTYGGTTGDATIRPFSIFWKHVDVLGTSMGSPSDFTAMLECFRGALRPAIDRVYPLEDVREAAQRLEAAEQFGKVVLQIS
ncbi:MAG: zinc-binding dehydrogenase [Vulcanimicrobiaceae bacterium]